MPHMNRAYRSRRRWLIAALSLSVCGAAAIPLIPVTAVNRLYLPMAFAIAIAGFAFYGLPFFWLAYADRRFCCRIVYAVESEHLRSVAAIAPLCGHGRAGTAAQIRKCQRRLYLTGYTFDGERLSTPADNTPKPREKRRYTCDNCGAATESDAEYPVCAYCGSPVGFDGENIVMRVISKT